MFGREGTPQAFFLAAPLSLHITTVKHVFEKHEALVSRMCITVIYALTLRGMFAIGLAKEPAFFSSDMTVCMLK
jgi:hypothetical protein